MRRSKTWLVLFPSSPRSLGDAGASRGRHRRSRAGPVAVRLEELRRVPRRPRRRRTNRARPRAHAGQGLVLRDRRRDVEPHADDGREDEGASARPPAVRRDESSRDLLAFLYFLNYFDEPGDARRRQSRSSREKHCIQCHAIGKEGGHAGPRLDAFPRGTSPLRIAQRALEPRPGDDPRDDARPRSGRADVPTAARSSISSRTCARRDSAARRARVPVGRRSGQRASRLFASKGCSRCHAVFGSGGSIGPDLGRAELRGSVTQLAGRMWNHWPAMSEAMESLGMAPPTFKGEDVADVFAYLFVSRYESRPGDLVRGRDDLPAEGMRRLPRPGGAGGRRSAPR